MGFFDRLSGSTYKKVISRLQKTVDSVNSFEASMKKLDKEDFPKKTEEFRKRLEVAEGNRDREKEIIEEILPEAFALVREASLRVWGERHFDVQVIGGIVLHQGKIAEMKTGEGKTLVATLPLYLNALTKRGVHLVTVNDYLSKHQGEGMGEVYHFLGMTTGVIQNNNISYKFEKNKDYKHYSECDGSNLTPCSRGEAYLADITYGTNNEFGFDYLRDNMAPDIRMCVQKELNFTIVDEVDSILIDEARTPLIISAQAEESASLYQQFASLVPKLKESEDYLVDEKDRVANLTDVGIKKMEGLLGVSNIYEEDSISLVHHLEQALKAQVLFKRDRDYVVREGEIVIVDEFTGRLMIGRRYSEGLHQAIEAKEGVEVKRESQTLATISFQNLFRMYDKLSGMTGTAATEGEEFYKIYKLDVVEIPTNKPMVRKDMNDFIYKTEKAKFEAVVADVKERNQKGQPILIGTVSVEKNEVMDKLLKKAGIKHEVLNAKHHEKEAGVIVRAGMRGAITVATNMAGRGTDIKLEKEVKDLGGLYVIGTERHEARRIDNQLRGRSGRQGDPGESRFYVSLDDDLMRIFGGEKLKNLMDRLGLPDDQPIENKMISRSIESAQRKVEGHNFDIRKHLVDYDDVMNKHREVIYKKRRAILELSVNPDEEKSSDIKNKISEEIITILEGEIEKIVSLYSADRETLEKEIRMIFPDVKIESYEAEALKNQMREIYKDKKERYGEEAMRSIEKAVYLRTIDRLWVEHLTTMEELREGIGLRGYGQRDPLVEYKQEAYQYFQRLLASIDSMVAKTILKVEARVTPTAPIQRKPLEYKGAEPEKIGGADNALEQDSTGSLNRDPKGSLRDSSSDSSTVSGEAEVSIKKAGKTVFERMTSSGGGGGSATIKAGKKVGRNDPCPCGSGKKYKKCCGR